MRGFEFGLGDCMAGVWGIEARVVGSRKWESTIFFGSAFAEHAQRGPRPLGMAHLFARA